MGVEQEIVYQGQLHCQATHGPSGRKLVTEAPIDNGGKGEEFSPTDLVATAMGSCMLTIMGIVAGKNNIPLEGATVRVTKDMAAAPVRRIGKLTVVITIPGGQKLPPENRSRLEQAAAGCPVKHSLHPDVAVSTTFVYA